MPLYEYECSACGQRFETIQKFSDKPMKKCPDCGGPVEQMISAPAVQFKGSGWYVTDYAKKSSGDGNSGKARSDEGKSGESKAADTKSSESKSGESKPAATPAATTKKSGD